MNPDREAPTEATPTSWTIETMRIVNEMTPDIKGKPFDPDWFLLRQRFEEIERQNTLQAERVIQLERALREYRLKVHNLEAHNQWFERCESQWCHPSEGRLFPEDLVQGDRAALEGKVNG